MDLKITLEIALSPSLEGFLTKVLGGQPAAPPKQKPLAEAVEERIAAQAEQETAAESETVQDPQPEAQRRTRRTKAQIAADEASAGSPASSTTEPDASSPADLSAALDAAEQPERLGVTVKADVAAKMQEAMAAASPKKVQDAMAEHLGGAKRLSEIDPALYGKALELFDTIIAG